MALKYKNIKKSKKPLRNYKKKAKTKITLI